MSFASFLLKILSISFFLTTTVFSAVVEKFIIDGNKRISDETVIMFSNVSLKDEISNKKINLILKDLYKTNYFENVNVSFEDKTLLIKVKEHPIIQKINYKGVKSKTLLEAITLNKLIKDKSPYNLFVLNNEKDRINKTIKELGYFNSKIETYVETLNDNLVIVNFNIDLRKKAKIKKISFIGNFIF